MWLEELCLENFCNFSNASTLFGRAVNILFGENAQGKSNLVDAISYLALMRGVRGLSDVNVVRFGTRGFVVRGVFAFGAGVERECRIEYTLEEGKRCTLDGDATVRRADLLGHFPVVIMSGDDYRITWGGPYERRRFMDLFLCQASMRYLDDLRRYTATLRQRNALLRSQVEPGSGQMSAWTEQLVEYGIRLMAARSNFVAAIGKLLNTYFSTIVGSSRALTVTYMPSVRQDEDKPIREVFLHRLKGMAPREKELGATLVGPHRDDIAIKIDGRDLRQFGSRGDHKAVLISLRLAEHALMRNFRLETPIFLMDDLLVDLDHKRSANLARLFPDDTQVIFTTTAPEAWRIMGLEASSFQYFIIQNGQIAQARV